MTSTGRVARTYIFDMALDVRVLSSYDEAAPYWAELEGTYARGELTWDLEAHRIIWEGFYRRRGAVLAVYVAHEDARCVGVVPLLHTDEDADGHWTFCDDFLIGREYFSPPDVLARLLPHLPPHLADDLSCFYRPVPVDGFRRMPGAIVDLGASEETYLASLPKKGRYQLKKTREANRDLEVVVDGTVRWGEIAGLRERYLEYWARKAHGDERRVAYSRDKVATDLALMDRAAALGKLVALYIRHGGKLVAANFSVLRGADRVDDYLCLRDASEDLRERGLGIWAVLRNMEICRARGVRFYDLSACVTDYKKRFLNLESWFYAWAGGPEYRAAAATVATGSVGGL